MDNPNFVKGVHLSDKAYDATYFNVDQTRSFVERFHSPDGKIYEFVFTGTNLSINRIDKKPDFEKLQKYLAGQDLTSRIIGIERQSDTDENKA